MGVGRSDDEQGRQCGTATNDLSSFEIRKTSIAIRQLSSVESSFMISRLPRRDHGRLEVQEHALRRSGQKIRARSGIQGVDRGTAGGAREDVRTDMRVRVDGDMRVNLDNTACGWGCDLRRA